MSKKDNGPWPVDEDPGFALNIDDGEKSRFNTDPDDGGLVELTYNPLLYEWECPNGHSWQGNGEGFTISLHSPHYKPEVKSQPICIYCVIEWLEKNFLATKIGG